MDPQSNPFAPQPDIWRLSNTINRVQEIQADHAERLSRLERRQEEDARVKSVWATSSSFPGVLSGTPQQGPAQHPADADFANFDDDHSNNMIRSLQLDTAEEPRRLGAASRANSVRFDESANQGQWSHTARSSVDYLSRSGSALGGLGHPLFERSTSHKSDGRHSSAGFSAVSGRANSLGLDVLSPLGPPAADAPGLAPGLLILGTVPSIIRCWMTQDFKHETLLYAAVCTGSYKSFLDLRLIEQLGLAGSVKQDLNGSRKIQVPVYLPEAIPQASTSRPSSPTSQLPFVNVDFTVIDNPESASPKAIQIFFGSDTLRAHNADVLFSLNQMSIYDESRNKMTVPFVRPEDDETFKSLQIVSRASIANRRFPDSKLYKPVDDRSDLRALPNGMSSRLYVNGAPAAPATDASSSKESESGGELQLPSEIDRMGVPSRDSSSTRATDRVLEDRKPVLSQINTSRTDSKDVAGDTSPPVTATSARTAPTTSPAIWNNWRRDSVQNQTQGDWASASKGGTASGFARPNREQGIKVLKPTRSVSRSSVPAVTQPSPSINPQSRFFDDGKRRNGNDGGSDPTQLKRAMSGDIGRAAQKENSSQAAGGTKSSVPNPIGGASAFGWLNSGGFGGQPSSQK